MERREEAEASGGPGAPCPMPRSTTSAIDLGPVDDLLEDHDHDPHRLLGILEATQAAYGHLPVAVIKEISFRTGAPYALVYGRRRFTGTCDSNLPRRPAWTPLPQRGGARLLSASRRGRRRQRSASERRRLSVRSRTGPSGPSGDSPEHDCDRCLESLLCGSAGREFLPERDPADPTDLDVALREGGIRGPEAGDPRARAERGHGHRRRLRAPRAGRRWPARGREVAGVRGRRGHEALCRRQRLRGRSGRVHEPRADGAATVRRDRGAREIAAVAVGASEAIVAVRTEYAEAVRRLEAAIANANGSRVLGQDILGAGSPCRCRSGRCRVRRMPGERDGPAQGAPGPTRPARAATAAPGDPRPVLVPQSSSTTS